MRQFRVVMVTEDSESEESSGESDTESETVSDDELKCLGLICHEDMKKMSPGYKMMTGAGGCFWSTKQLLLEYSTIDDEYDSDSDPDYEMGDALESAKLNDPEGNYWAEVAGFYSEAESDSEYVTVSDSVRLF